MKKGNYLLYFTRAVTLVFLAFMISCNTPAREEKSKNNTSNKSTKREHIQSIPEAVTRFLIDSAAGDFNEHQPPTAIDIRNVKAGYISSGRETTYLICGEFLSREEKDWVQFVTIKTAGYEQYIGDNMYCQEATFEKPGNDRLSGEIKRKLNSIKR